MTAEKQQQQWTVVTCVSDMYVEHAASRQELEAVLERSREAAEEENFEPADCIVVFEGLLRPLVPVRRFVLEEREIDNPGKDDVDSGSPQG